MLASTSLAADGQGQVAKTGVPEAADPTASLSRLRASVEYLAGPTMEGRGPGTPGIDAAGEWVRQRFAELGLSALPDRDTSLQPFPMTLDAKLGPPSANTAELVGPPGPDGAPTVVTLELGRDYTPLAAGGSGAFDLPLAFAGYGITAPAEDYDDYASFDPKGHAVIVLRHEPQQDDPHSVFDGNQNSQYAALSRKVANASEHEVAGVVFCNDGPEVRRMVEAARRKDESHAAGQQGSTDAADDGDRLMDFTRAGDGTERRRMPVLQVKRALLDRVVRETAGTSIDAIEEQIDHELAPASKPLTGWRIRGTTAIERTEAVGRNVLAILPGKGPHAKEVVVLGAHYDHLGYGGSNSASPEVRAVHHGADDNASGTAMLIEVARLLAAAGPFDRTILFIAFSGEERGLLGSAHYTANPVVPLDDTVAMVNLDMVGRLVDDKLIVHGTGTGEGFDSLVDRLTFDRGFTVAKEPGGFGPSDHSSFYAKRIPVLHLFTGSHADYHRPTDTAEKVNYDGMDRITGLVTELVGDLADLPERPGYIEVASKQFARGGDRPYFGSVPDFGKPGGGYAISGVAKDSPAARGGLQGGDVIVRIGESAVTNLEDFDSALRKHKAGDTVPVVVRRDGAEKTLEVTLDPPR
ncbi:MAG: M28 family peptidase [Planctomycetaceae bacterium]